MTILDYSTEAELYPNAREVELSPVRRRKRRQPDPIDLKVWDRAPEVKIDCAELLIMKESDLMGVVVEALTKKLAA
jgi:hypothetical protein